MEEHVTSDDTMVQRDTVFLAILDVRHNKQPLWRRLSRMPVYTHWFLNMNVANKSQSDERHLCELFGNQSRV